MILLDPDLDVHPAPALKRRSRLADSTAIAKQDRLPSVRSLGGFLRTAQAAVRLKGAVSVLLTTDDAIRRLNRQFRGKNKATDVLSFPAEGVGPEKVAGDLAISVETARKQAAEQGHALGIEMKVLMLHGLLHLAGFDHEADEGEMARRELKLRTGLGLPLGLIERSWTPAPSPERRRKDGARTQRGSGDRRQARKATADPSTRLLRKLSQDDKHSMSAAVRGGKRA